MKSSNDVVFQTVMAFTAHIEEAAVNALIIIRPPYKRVQVNAFVTIKFNFFIEQFLSAFKIDSIPFIATVTQKKFFLRRITHQTFYAVLFSAATKIL